MAQELRRVAQTVRDRSPLSTFLLRQKHGGQCLSPDQIRLLLAARGMLRDIKPHLKDVTSGHTIVQNDRAKHGFVVPWNTYVDIRIDVYTTSRKAELLENLRLDTL